MQSESAIFTKCIAKGECGVEARYSVQVGAQRGNLHLFGYACGAAVARNTEKDALTQGTWLRAGEK